MNEKQEGSVFDIRHRKTFILFCRQQDFEEVAKRHYKILPTTLQDVWSEFERGFSSWSQRRGSPETRWIKNIIGIQQF